MGEWLQEAECDGKQRHQGESEHPVESSLPHNPSPTQQLLKARALHTQRPCTGTGNHMSKGAWPRTEVLAGQGTLPTLHSRQPLNLLLPCPPCTASSASYHSCQQLIQERAKAPAVSCFGGLHDPPHFCRKRQRGVRAGSSHTVLGTSHCLQKPPHANWCHWAERRRSQGTHPLPGALYSSSRAWLQ